MANKYSILVEAKLDPVESERLIKTQLDAISTKINFEIKNITVNQATITSLKTQIQNGLQGISVGVTGGGASSGGGGTPSIIGGNPITPSGGGIGGVDIQARIAEIQRTALGGTINFSGVSNELGTMTNAVLKYQNAAKTAITETYGLREGIEGLTLVGTRFSDSMSGNAIAVQKQIADAEKLISSTQSITKGKSGKVVTDAKNSLIELTGATQGLKDIQGQTGIVVEQAQGRLANATKTTEQFNGAVRAGGKNLQSWGTEIGVALKRTIEWAGAMTLLYGSLRQVQAGIEYVTALNKELINIQIVTGESTDSVARMAKGFNQLAGELGATTKEVAAGSLEWYRQGKTAQETAVLLKDSTMMAKLANLDAAASTQYMTSILNGFQLQAEDMMGVLDSLVNLDNRYATSVG